MSSEAVTTGNIPPTDNVTGRPQLAPFDPRFAADIVDWVETDDELRWVAPSTHKPLTAAKVAAWKRPDGEAFVLVRDGDPQPIGYGELNPMRDEPTYFWLGHVIVRPDQRGHGVGKTLVRALLEQAFDRRLAGRVLLIVFPDNTAAVKCYQRVGFRNVGEEYHRFGGIGPRERLFRFEIERPDLKPDPMCGTFGA